MSHDLAILVRHIGVDSETFVRKHIEDLHPGRTVVIAEDYGHPDVTNWSVDCPVFFFGRNKETTLARKLVGAACRRTGFASRYDGARARRFLGRHRVQVVLGEWLDTCVPWIDALKKSGLRFFAYALGYDVSERRLSQKRWKDAYAAFNRADGIIAQSHLIKSRLVSMVGLAESSIHVVPCSPEVPAQPQIREEGSTVRCLAVGRMVTKKGPIFTLDAFRRAREAEPDLHLDFVGDGPLFPAAQQYVDAFKLHDSVTLHGKLPREALPKLLGDADVYLQHSVVDPLTGDEEGLPVAVLEAMAAALPVVATDHAGIPEAVIEGETGFLVAERDVVGMSERTLQLVRDRVLRRRLGEAGWRRARACFSWEREKQELRKILGLDATQA